MSAAEELELELEPTDELHELALDAVAISNALADLAVRTARHHDALARVIQTLELQEDYAA